MGRKSKRSSGRKSTSASKTSQRTSTSGGLVLETEFPVKRIRTFLATSRPPPTLTIAQWSDRERFLPAEAAEPGRWHTDRVPYMKGVMDAVNDPVVQRIVVAKGVQIGYTESMNCVLGYYMDQDPASMLVIMPTLELAQSWSKDRLA